MKKALLTAIMILSIFALMLSLSACAPTEDADFDYTVSIVDSSGAPVKDIIYKVLLGEDEKAFGLTNETGSFSGTLAEGTYKVELDSPFGNSFYYNKDEAVLSAATPNLTITLYEVLDKTVTEGLFFQTGGEPGLAASFRDGAYRVELKAGINYFVFVPTVRGLYEISAGDDSSVSLGYYGGPYYVQSDDIANSGESGGAEKKDGKLYFEIRAFNIGDDYASTSKYVIGITAQNDTAVLLSAKKIANLEMNAQEMPWNEFILQNDPASFTVPFGTAENINLVDFDITDNTQTVVYNSNDGYYHLGTVDGPVMLLRVSTNSKYLESFSFKSLCENTFYACYLFNDDGTFKSKISYHDMMLKYINAADSKYGVVPLDKNLAESILNYGKYNRWFDLSSGFNLFGDLASSVVEENAWLFATCYVEGYETDNSDAPYKMKSEGSLVLNGTGAVYLKNEASVAVTFVLKYESGAVKIITDSGEILDTEGSHELTVEVAAGEVISVLSMTQDSLLPVTYTTASVSAEE